MRALYLFGAALSALRQDAREYFQHDEPHDVFTCSACERIDSNGWYAIVVATAVCGLLAACVRLWLAR